MNEFADIFDEAIPVKEKRETVKPKAGSSVGILYSIVDCGTLLRTDKKDPSKTYEERTLELSFELPSQTAVFDGVSKPLVVHDGFVRYQLTPAKLSQVNNATGATRPTLSGYAAALIGSPSGFKLGQLIGKACILTLVESSKGDKTYVNVSAANPLVEGMAVKEQSNPSFAYSIKLHGFLSVEFDALPDFRRAKLLETLEFAAFEKANPAEARGVRASVKN